VNSLPKTVTRQRHNHSIIRINPGRSHRSTPMPQTTQALLCLSPVRHSATEPPLEVGPFNPATGSGERCNFPPSWLIYDAVCLIPRCVEGPDTLVMCVSIATLLVLRQERLTCGIGNESVPIQLAQCRFPGLAISDAKILMYFSNKIHGSNFIKQHSETDMV